MPPFNLTITSFTPPKLPQVDVQTYAPSAIKSWALIPPALRPLTSLRFTILLPGARSNNPIHPATHLQMQYCYGGNSGVFVPDVIKPDRLVQLEEENSFEVEIDPKDIPRCKVDEGNTSAASVIVYVWKGEKLLGQWAVGEIDRLGFEGFKSTELHKARVAVWKANGKLSE